MNAFIIVRDYSDSLQVTECVDAAFDHVTRDAVRMRRMRRMSLFATDAKI